MKNIYHQTDPRILATIQRLAEEDGWRDWAARETQPIPPMKLGASHPAPLFSLLGKLIP